MPASPPLKLDCSLQPAAFLAAPSSPPAEAAGRLCAGAGGHSVAPAPTGGDRELERETKGPGTAKLSRKAVPLRHAQGGLRTLFSVRWRVARRACEVQEAALYRLQGAHLVTFRGKAAQLGDWSSGSCDCSTAMIGDSAVVSPLDALSSCRGWL